jgi:hypothetical protein
VCVPTPPPPSLPPAPPAADHKFARKLKPRLKHQNMATDSSSADERLDTLFVEPDRLFQKERGVVELRAVVAGVPELERAASRQLGLAPSTRLKLLWTEPVMGITDELWSLAELQQMRPEEVVGVALREPGEMVRAAGSAIY